VKHILITGANGGIGRALCEEFSGAGSKVLATDVHPSADVKCDHYLSLDLAAFVDDEAIREGFRQELVELLNDGRLSALVNNAALQVLNPFERVSGEDLRKTLDVNVVAPFLLIQLCLPWLERANGSVVNIGSIHARATKPGFSAYATSKTALTGLTQALAVELGSRVRVNAIQPAAVATAMLRAGFADSPDALETLEHYHPVGHIATPKEVARVARFLASADASFMNGAVVDVTGGIHCRLYDPN
jgi:NAD(P)-dependent dehydrogenase (short-subunit alcohol dehydrogenase family)